MKNKKGFKEIFKEHWEKFKKKFSGYNDEYYDEVVQKMLGCGDVINGYTEHCCTTCGLDIRRIAFSCKGTFCLSCGKVYSDSVVAHVSKVLHPGVSYRHIVLTIPEQLRDIFYKNRKNKGLYSALMRVGYQCLEDVVCSVRKQAVKIGAIVSSIPMDGQAHIIHICILL